MKMIADYLIIVGFGFPICFSLGLFFIIGAKKDLPVLMHPKEREGISSYFSTSKFWISIRESFGEKGLRIYHYFFGMILIILPIFILVISVNADIRAINYEEQESFAEYQVDIGQRLNGTWSEYPDSVELRNSEGILVNDYSWGKGYIKRDESLVIDLGADKPFMNPEYSAIFSDGIGRSLYIKEVKGRKDSIRMVYELTSQSGIFIEIVFHLNEPNIMQLQNVTSRRWGFRDGGRRQILYRNSGPDYYQLEE